MIPNSNTLSRLFPAAALVAALGMSMPACAQAEKVADAEPATDKAAVAAQSDDAKARQAIVDDLTPATETAEQKEKTPEEIAREKEQKEIAKLKHESQLRAARLAAELAPLQETKQRLEAEIALLTAKQQAQQAKVKLKNDQAEFEQSMKLAALAREVKDMQQKVQTLTIKGQVEKLEQAQETAKLSAASNLLQAELALLEAERAAASIDKDQMQYPAKPLKDGTLTISDRRIPLNGAIGGGTADYVTERIHYYNNLNSEAPIFIVIDSSPGGSVMEGFRIVTAMKNSDAPVHVVVKSFAASMAAVITTLAEESYAYPNAVMLHHQMSSGMRGNLTQQKESLEEGFEWSNRLAVPVAKKMGVSYEKFVKLMYENNSDGDWAEFADKAKKLKWVNHVIDEIRETALVKAPAGRRYAQVYLQAEQPEGADAMPQGFTQEELFRSPIQFETKTDGNGRSYIELPQLQPYDYYFMHDPDQRYQIAR